MLLSGRIYIALGPWRFGDFFNIFLPNIGEDQKKSYDFSSGPLTDTQARSQKFALWGLVWGSEGGAPGHQRPMGVRGRSPQRSKILHFLQNELNFKAILIENNAFRTWHRNWQPNMIQLVALMGYMGSG